MSDKQRRCEARVIEAKCPRWVVLWGVYTRRFWAFGSPDGRPIEARSAAELIGFMRAAERLHSGPYYQQGSPYRGRIGVPGID
jgi:hypothetical protein